MERVFARLANPAADTYRMPRPVGERPKVGVPGMSASRLAPEAPEIRQRVRGESSKAFSSSRTLAARPEIWMGTPSRLRTANETGDAALEPPTGQVESATRNRRVDTG